MNLEEFKKKYEEYYSDEDYTDAPKRFHMIEVPTVRADWVEKLRDKKFQYPTIYGLTTGDRVLFADSTGLGKTSMTLVAICNVLARAKDPKGAVIYVYNSIASQWQREVRQVTTLSSVILSKDSYEQSAVIERFKNKEIDILIVPYSRMSNELSNTPCTVIVCDEAEAIKAATSERAKFIDRHQERTQKLWLITATPYTGHLEDSLVYLALMYAGKKTYYQLLNRYTTKRQFRTPLYKKTMTEHGQYRYAGIDGYININEFKEKLQYFTLKSFSNKVLESMPRVIDRVFEVEMTPEIAECQKKLDTGLYVYENGKTRYKINSLQKCTMKSKLMHDPRTYGIEANPKLDELKKIVEKLVDKGKQVAIYIHFKDTVKDMLKAFSKYMPVQITGDKSMQERVDAIEALRVGQARILILSSAGFAGVDLPFMQYLIFYDPELSYSRVRQIQGRIRRVNSTFEKVYIGYLVYKGGFDEYLTKNFILEKKEFAEELAESSKTKDSRRKIRTRR